MLMPRLFIILLLSLVVTGVAQAPAQSQISEGVAAIVNDEVISTFDVRQRMRMIISSSRVKPDEKTIVRIQQQALRSLVDERLQLQEAKKFDIVVSQQEIDQAIARLARQNNITLGDVKNDLLKAGISPTTLESQIRAQIAWQILVNGRYGSRVKVSNNQIAQSKSRMEAALTKPQYLISEVLLESPSPEQDPVIFQGAMSLTKQMRDGAPFQAVAQQFSAAPSSAQGGDVGWVHKNDLAEEIQEVLDTMQVGTVSPPIKVPGGYYLIALRDRKDGGAPMMVNFRQVVVPAEQKEKLASFMKKAKSCDAVGKVKGSISGSFSNAFEDVSLTELAPAVRVVLENLQPGQTSKPVESPQGATAFMVCDKHYAEGAGIPNDEQIADQLINTRLAMLSRRYLRDLRRDSTVEIRK
jgi:peptidyl-prolyl cis-trans isomerase SurA